MKRVKLITGLQIEEVVAYNPSHIQVVESYNHSFSPSDSTMLATEERKVHVVPIKHWVDNWVTLDNRFGEHTTTEEGYIAASTKIDEVLGKYLRCCHNEITYLKERETKLQGQLFDIQNKFHYSSLQLTKYETLTFWQRLKFLFKGNIYE
jgi:hypothetical protein